MRQAQRGKGSTREKKKKLPGDLTGGFKKKAFTQPGKRLSLRRLGGASAKKKKKRGRGGRKDQLLDGPFLLTD